MASYGWVRVTDKDIKSELAGHQGELWQAFYLAISGRTYHTVDGAETAQKMLAVLLPEGYSASVITVSDGWQVILRRRP